MPYPSRYISLRGIEEECYTLIDITRLEQGGQAKILEEVETRRALFEAYEGAVVRLFFLDTIKLPTFCI